jgi:hypothetical protein
MDRGKAIDLNSLTRSHCEDIDQMLAAIRGNPGSSLWTAEMRAAIRGGKVLGITRVDAATLEESTD